MNTTIPARRRSLGLAKLLLICAALGLAGGGVAAIASAFGFASGPLAYAGAMLVAGPIALALTYRWWGAVDEGVREAHKTSWFWGGSVGLVFVGATALGLFGISQGDTPIQYGFTREEARMVLSGIVLTVAFLLAGYGVCWAGWWFTRSR